MSCETSRCISCCNRRFFGRRAEHLIGIITVFAHHFDLLRGEQLHAVGTRNRKPHVVNQLILAHLRLAADRQHPPIESLAQHMQH